MDTVVALHRGPARAPCPGGGRDEDRFGLRGIDGIEDAGEAHLVEEFLSGFGRETAACYRRDLADLARFLSARGATLISTTRTDLRGYVEACEAAGAAPATVARRLAATSAFFHFAVGQGRIAASPLQGFRRPKQASAPRLGLEPEALGRLWRAASSRGGAVQLLVGLLLIAGLRVSEATGLDAEHVVRRGGRMYARVRRKGGRSGLVALVPPLDRLVDAALAAWGAGPLLRGARGGRLGRQRAWEMVRALGSEVGVEVHPHLLRHSHVTAALEAGVGIVAVAASAGHRDVRTTAGYAEALRAVAGGAGVAVARVLGEAPGEAS